MVPKSLCCTSSDAAKAKLRRVPYRGVLRLGIIARSHAHVRPQLNDGAHHQRGRTFVLSLQEAMPHSASTKSTTVTDRRMLAHMQQRPQKSSKNTGKFSDTCTDEAALSRARKKCRGQGINLLVACALSDAADIGITS